MKIDSVNDFQSTTTVFKKQNYVNNTASTVGLSKDTVNFTGKYTKEITALLPQKKALDFLKSCEKVKGEFGGILITALGTGLVAPIFIANNPFVKAPENATEEEKLDVKNTKRYTAWRQPISAVLAAIFQLSVLGPIDRGLDYLLNNKETAAEFGIDVDQSVLNSKSYLEIQEGKKLKQEGMKKPNKLLTFFSKDAREKRQLFDDTVKANVAAKMSEQSQKLAETFQQTGEIRIGDRIVNHEDVANYITKQIDEYVSDAESLKFDKNKLAHYANRSELLMNNKDRLIEIFKDIPNDDKAVTEMVTDLLKNEENPQVKKILQEILDLDPELRSRRMTRTLDRIDSIEKMCKGGYTRDNYVKAMTERNGELDKIITNLELTKIKEPASADKNIIQETINKLTKACRFDPKDKTLSSIVERTDTFDSSVEKLGKKIHKDIVNQYKKACSNRYKGFSQVMKVAIGVFITLPITCNVLNWIYPRFMNLVFPSMSASSKTNKSQEVKDGGDK